MWNRNWSASFFHDVVLGLAMMTLVTGMALDSRSKKALAVWSCAFGDESGGEACNGSTKRPPNTLSVQTSPDIEPWRPYYISHSCEWTLLSLNCPMGRVINIVRANYGRQNLDYCPHLRAKAGLNWDTPCVGSISKSRRIVSGICNGKPRCEVPVFNGLFGDPCPSTYKYLEVYYACVEASPRVVQK